MGPRRWGRGRVELAAKLRKSPLQLQWGRDDGVAEEVCPTIVLARGDASWGRDDGVAEEPEMPRGGRGAPPRFNGAATMGSRKRARRRDGLRGGTGASMGPRRWGRGRARRFASSRCRRPSFNGAATMGSRKSKTGSPSEGRGHVLQWGRDDGVAEEVIATLLGERPMAPNGAARWGRGRGRLVTPASP